MLKNDKMDILNNDSDNDDKGKIKELLETISDGAVTVAFIIIFSTIIFSGFFGTAIASIVNGFC